jgi:hypothetical protein
LFVCRTVSKLQCLYRSHAASLFVALYCHWALTSGHVLMWNSSGISKFVRARSEIMGIVCTVEKVKSLPPDAAVWYGVFVGLRAWVELLLKWVPQMTVTPSLPRRLLHGAWRRVACNRAQWSRVLLEKLTGFLLVKEFSAYCGTRRFNTAFTSARRLSLS